ncbi:MAG TPA: DUF4199 domain-containing protein [Ohtaekwangia sp.]|nr:DUF4199 domain-containing protein [Ohtaekwangia sp.]
MKGAPLLSVALRYGAAAGILAALLLIGTYYIGGHPVMISPFLDFRLLLFGVFVFFTLKELRDYHQQGVLYFWQGMIGALLVVLSASIISTAGMLVFGMLEKQFVTDYIVEMEKYLRTFNAAAIAQVGKEMYERNLALLPSTNITDLATTYFVQGLVLGFFVSIILSVIVRKHPKL